MNRRSYLFVAIGAGSWGRMTTAIRIANELVRRGAKVEILMIDALRKLVQDTELQYRLFCKASIPLIHLLIHRAIADIKPCTLVYVDYFPTIDTVLRRDVDPNFLFPKDLRTVAIDVWDFARTGLKIDCYDGTTHYIAKGSRSLHDQLWNLLSFKISPVPMLSLERRKDLRLFSDLPRAHLRMARSDFREQLGLGNSGKIVLFCTAPWQQASGYSPEVKNIASRNCDRFDPRRPTTARYTGRYFSRSLSLDTASTHVQIC